MGSQDLTVGNVHAEPHSRIQIIYQQPISKLRSCLKSANNAFNSYAMEEKAVCLQDTRTDLLGRIRAWIHGEEESCIFWLNGMAGTGKSTISKTIAQELSREKCLGASFFFSRGGGDAANAGLFFTSIALQLAEVHPSLGQYISEAVEDHPGIEHKCSDEQWKTLIKNPLSRLQQNGKPTRLVIVVDALDECDSAIGIREIINALRSVQEVSTVKVRVFITSRPEIAVRQSFQISEILHRKLLLHEEPRKYVDADIRRLFNAELASLKLLRLISPHWSDDRVINRLVLLADGLFIFAATVCRFLRESAQRGESVTKVLLRFLPSSSSEAVAGVHDSTLGSTGYDGLDAMYTTVIKSSIIWKAEVLLKRKKALGIICALDETLRISTLTSLLKIEADDLRARLDGLHSVLRVPSVDYQPVSLYHASFRDFIFDSMRCKDERLQTNRKEIHAILIGRCPGHSGVKRHTEI